MKSNAHRLTESVLVTGGSDGIGLGLASRYFAAGAEVMVTGRNFAKLERVAAQHVGLKTFVSDISSAAERERLADHVARSMPKLSILINNAGIQRRVSLAADTAPWLDHQSEIDTLLSGPVHLCHLLVPLMLSQDKPTLVVNVTSGGAFIPQPFAPLYSACKAAMHSYTMNLRFALARTSCKVVEVIPPAVRTALAGNDVSHGVSLDEFCESIFNSLTTTYAAEVGYGPTEAPVVKERLSLDHQMFENFSGRFPVITYSKSDTSVDAPNIGTK